MTALHLFDDDREREEAEAAQRRRWAEHDADFTPPDVCRLGAWAVRKYILAGLLRAMRIRRRKRLRILGPCAGAGPWLAACREFFPDAELRAMDIREEERPHLTHHVGAENVQIGDFLQWRPERDEDRPDLILDNLPFKLALDFLQHGQDVLAPGGVAVWFVRLTLGDRDAVNDWLEANPYSHRFEFVDRFKFRVGINPKTGDPWGVDSTGYKMLGFTEGEAPDTYLGKRLPSLPVDSRRWRKTRSGLDVRPGTEYLYKPDELEPSLWAPPERCAEDRWTRGVEQRPGETQAVERITRSSGVDCPLGQVPENMSEGAGAALRAGVPAGGRVEGVKRPSIGVEGQFECGSSLSVWRRAPGQALRAGTGGRRR